jgi:uncharacterized membrane protein YeaQ/YmgE (transglycosylase-associated protein family)
LLFGFIISTLLGSLFHLVRGGSAGRLLLYLILGWAGFWLGHILAQQFDWTFATFGPLHLGPAVIGSLVFLAVGYWLSLNSSGKK